MLYIVLAGLICTTSNINPDNSRYFFVRNVITVLSNVRFTENIEKHVCKSRELEGFQWLLWIYTDARTAKNGHKNGDKLWKSVTNVETGGVGRPAQNGHNDTMSKLLLLLIGEQTLGKLIRTITFLQSCWTTRHKNGTNGCPAQENTHTHRIGKWHNTNNREVNIFQRMFKAGESWNIL